MPQEPHSLSRFLADLFQHGEVVVKNQLSAFSPQEQQKALILLEQIHQEEQLNTPKDPIAFDAKAALWAAEFLYKSVQLTLIRQLDEASIKKELQLYQGTIDPSAICSADLTLRYMGNLRQLASGMAPGDSLLYYFDLVAGQWPYSAIGWAALPNKEALFGILRHEGLRLLFLERIIEKKAITDINKLELTPWIEHLTGLYPEELLPEIYNRLQHENEATSN